MTELAEITELKTLSPNWLAYCYDFARTLNVQSARDASGLTVTMVKKHNNDPLVLEQITNNMKQVAMMANVDKSMVLNKLHEMTESDIGDIHDAIGNILPIHQWSKIMRQQLVSYETDEITGRITKVKFIDKLKVLALLGKHVDVGAFEEKITVKHELSDKLSKRMARARKRLDAIEGEVIHDDVEQ